MGRKYSIADITDTRAHTKDGVAKYCQTSKVTNVHPGTVVFQYLLKTLSPACDGLNTPFRTHWIRSENLQRLLRKAFGLLVLIIINF